jgi:aryl-phospho-beta-D-glucosidase BglC (GH1 family)
MIGVNLAGAEFGSASGVYGTSYIYPTASELDYFKSEGITLIRLPFMWERAQHTLGGPLDEAEVGRIHTFLDQAAARGMQVVLDVHNYGRYGGQAIGSDAVPTAAFADFWSKMAKEFGGDAGIAGFGLMNEPHDMGGAGVWMAAAQAAVDAIRASGATENIVVAGDGWSSAGMWQLVNGNLAINDALNKIVYEAHIYFDHDNSGTYQGTYDQEGATPDTGVRRLQVFQDWLAAHDAKGFIGEFGVPGDDPRWLTALGNLVDAMHKDGIDGTAWAAGPWWGNYPLSLEPSNGVDKPQLDILSKYASDAATSVFDVTGNTIIGSSGDDVINATHSALHQPFATDAGDIISGMDGNDMIAGGAGADRIDGGAGNDVLNGGTGADTMIGGTGDDRYVMDNPGDVVVENAGGGIDTVRSSVSYMLADNVENLTLLGAGNRSGTGNAEDNVITGNAGNNVLSGLDGNDTLIGGAGRDTLAGGAGNDTFVFGPGFGRDTVTDFASGSDVLQFDSRVFADAEHVLAASVQVGADVVITCDADNSVTLKNVALASLHAGDFLFT